MLRYHYERLSRGLRRGAARGVAAGEIGADVDPEVTAWALMGLGELIGMRWILWNGARELPPQVGAELERIIRCVLEAKRVRRVGLRATASYLPEQRWSPPPSCRARSGIPEERRRREVRPAREADRRAPTST